jgi:hypothetical protein
MARSRSKHQRKKMKIRQAWKKRRKTQKAAAKPSSGKPSTGKAPAA